MRCVPILAALLFATAGCHNHSRHSSHATEVRFFHAANDLGKLHFVIDGYLRATLHRYEMSEYVRMGSGWRYLEVWDDVQRVFWARVHIEDGDEQTFNLVGSSGGNRLEAVQVLDPDGQSPPETTRISFFNASPDSPALDLEIEGQPAFSAARYIGSHPVPGWVTVDSGLVRFTLRETGGRRRFGPFALPAASRRDMTVAVTNLDAVMELRIWDDIDARAVVPQSRLRLLNASPELGPLELRIGGEPLANPVPFRAASPYALLPAGEHAVEIRTAHATPVAGRITLEAATDYTAMVTGTPAAAVAVMHVDGPFVAERGTFVLDVFHLGRDAGPIDLRVNGMLPAALRALPFLSSDPPPAPPPALLVDLAAPAARVDVFEAFEAGGSTRLDRTDLVAEEDGVYSVVLLGNRTAPGPLGAGDCAPRLLVFDEIADGRALSRLRPGHASPGRGPLTFKVDDAAEASALSPSLTYLGQTGAPGAYVHLAPGSRTLVVTASGATATVAASRLETGYAADGTVFVLDASVASPTPRLAEVRDPDGPFPPPPGRARVRLHHAARGLAQTALDLHVSIVSANPLARDVFYTTASAYAEVPAGPGQTLILTPAGQPGTVLLVLSNLAFPAGRDFSLAALATNGPADLTESVLLADN
ncbi:MAG: DUF4397 domain-containing protein [Planctomycetes bacterium]|nr:DUF4397 domain-containing protein [Planctomycetota bacterium]